MPDRFQPRRNSDEIVKAHAPQAELDLLKAYSEYEQNIDAPNEIIRDEIRTKRTAAWRAAVLKIGNFQRWSAEVVNIIQVGELFSGSLSISKSLRMSQREPSYSPRLGLLSVRNQLVYISGHITETSLAILEATTNEVSPTCFEGGGGGCEVTITSIEPIQ